MKKGLYCKYDSGFSLEKSVAALRVYIPTKLGYVNYNVAHAVHSEIFCDTWRLSHAFACDDNFENEYCLNPSAEWDMALRIQDRDDFIGGQLHGDEIFSSVKFFIDGVQKEITCFAELTAFNVLTIEVESVGLDPSDHKTEVLKHFKKYVINADGVAVEQRVEWLGDYLLTSCYLAMMPPFKEFTDSYYTDIDTEVKRITVSDFAVKNCKSATLFGEKSGLLFRMSVPKYPSYETGNQLLVSDNRGRPYNKMYFSVCRSASVRCGEIWESRTEYVIQNGV